MKIPITLITFLFIISVSGNMAFGQLAVLNVPDLKPTIDGVIDENDPWKADAWIEQLAYKDGSTRNHSSKFQVVHDEDIIYIGVQVTDATPFNSNETSYFNDCVEIFFHMDGGSVDGTEVAYTASTSQTRFQRDQTTVANDGNIYSALVATAGFAYEVVSDDAGWVLEVAFPIAGLDPAGNFDGTNFMFEINSSDGNANDDTRTGLVFWQNNSDNQWQYVESFSPAHFSTGDEPNISNYHFFALPSICEGEVYSWQGNDYTEPGTYYANYTTIDGGDSIYKLTLQVNEKPGNFIITGLSDVKSDQIETYYVPIGSKGNYQWDAQNGNIISYPSSNSAAIQWSKSGTGMVSVVSVNNECNSDTAKLEVNISPLAIELPHLEGITIFPNPFTDILMIECESPVKITIYDLMGTIRLISEKKNVDVSTLNPGPYIIRIKDQYGTDMYSSVITRQ